MFMATVEIAGLGPYVARLDDVDHMAKIMQLESLKRNIAEAGLNEHLIKVHVPIAQLMKRLGFQYDAELAAFLGISLQETADEAMGVISAIAEGRFADTSTFAKMAENSRIFRPHEQPLEADSHAHLLETELQYTDRLKAELQTLPRLGVASVDTYDTPIEPMVHDPFFMGYGIVKV